MADAEPLHYSMEPATHSMPALVVKGALERELDRQCCAVCVHLQQILTHCIPPQPQSAWVDLFCVFCSLWSKAHIGMSLLQSSGTVCLFIDLVDIWSIFAFFKYYCYFAQ